MILLSLRAEVRNFSDPHMNLLGVIFFTERSKSLCLIGLLWFSFAESTYSLALLFAAWLPGH